MGVSFCAYAAVGVMIDKSKLMRAVKVRNCGHPETAGKFCPECGKPTWQESKEPIEGYEPDWDRLCGLKARRRYDNDNVLVSPDIVEADGGYRESEVMRQPPDVAAIREQIRAALEPLGLWDEGKFGLWCVADVSC